MMFVNPPGVTNFRALRVESGDQHLYWQPTYQHILRVEGAFGEFFPQAEFSENGNQVIFTKYVDKSEVLAQTRSLRPGERIPRGEWQRFMETWSSFKRLADRTDVPDDVRNFIVKFGPPSVERYPAAYRIYRPHWYSKPRLFILWGLEPVGGAEFVSLTAEEAITEATARAETDGQEASGNLLHWLKLALVCLLGLALLLFLLWLCLPRPVVDFTVSAEAEKPAKVVNLTTIDRSLDWGSREYRWDFNQAKPDSSTDIVPAPIWAQAGDHEVTLEATQSTLWGLLYKTESLSKIIVVTPPPAPQPEEVKPGPLPKGDSPNPRDKNRRPKKMFGNDKPNPDSTPEAPGGKGMSPPIPSDGTLPKQAPVTKPTAPGDQREMEPIVPGVPRKTLPGDPRGDDGKSEPSMPGPGKLSPLPKDGQSMPSSKVGKDGANPDGGRSPGDSAPGYDKGKMTPSSENNPGRSKLKSDQDKLKKPGEGMPPPEGTPSPSTQPKSAPPPEENRGKMLPPGEPVRPAVVPPEKRAGSNVRTLPVPSVQIRDITVLPGGASQDIDFTLNLPAGVRIDRLSVDGQPVAVSPALGFRTRLGVGPHSVRIEYGSPNGDLHGEVTQDVVVDRDEVRIIKPRTRIAPPVQVPGSEQPATRPAVPGKVRDEAAEKFDKKTA
jgi:hypothetical protein